MKKNAIQYTNVKIPHQVRDDEVERTTQCQTPSFLAWSGIHASMRKSMLRPGMHLKVYTSLNSRFHIGSVYRPKYRCDFKKRSYCVL